MPKYNRIHNGRWLGTTPAIYGMPAMKDIDYYLMTYTDGTPAKLLVKWGDTRFDEKEMSLALISRMRAAGDWVDDVFIVAHELYKTVNSYRRS